MVERYDATIRNAALLALVGSSDVNPDALAQVADDMGIRDIDPAERRARVTAAVFAAGGD